MPYMQWRTFYIFNSHTAALAAKAGAELIHVLQQLFVELCAVVLYLSGLPYQRRTNVSACLALSRRNNLD